MGDTVRGDFSDKICSDCGERGCYFFHRSDEGALMPKGERGYFCLFCWNERNEAYYRGETQKPLGVIPPGIPEELSGKPLMITTSEDFVYFLDAGDNPSEMIVYCEKQALYLARAKVLRLALGKDFWLRFYDGQGGFLRGSRVIFIASHVFSGKKKKLVAMSQRT